MKSHIIWAAAALAAVLAVSARAHATSVFADGSGGGASLIRQMSGDFL